MRKFLAALLLSAFCVLVAGVGYASDTYAKTEKANGYSVGEVSPALCAAIPVIGDDYVFHFGEADLPLAFEFYLSVKNYDVPAIVYKSRPGNYRYLNGLLHSIPNSKRY